MHAVVPTNATCKRYLLPSLTAHCLLLMLNHANSSCTLIHSTRAAPGAHLVAHHIPQAIAGHHQHLVRGVPRNDGHLRHTNTQAAAAGLVPQQQGLLTPACPQTCSKRAC